MRLSKSLVALGLVTVCAAAALAAEPPALQKPEWAYAVPTGPAEPAVRRDQRLYSLPSLPSYLMTVTILYSMSRQRAAQALCDLYFHPPLTRVGMLQWNRREPIIQRGYAHALQVLDEKQITGPGVYGK